MPHARAAHAPTGSRFLIPQQRRPARQDKRNALRASGHRIVTDILGTQPAPSGSWHHLPGGIDHVHVARSGVFAVMDVCVPGQMALVMQDTMLMGGSESDLIIRADAHSKMVATRLADAGHPDIPVRTLIVFTHYRRLIVRNSPSHATVLSTSGLRDWLDRRADLFSEAEATEIVGTSERACTWGLTQWEEPPDPLPIMAQQTWRDRLPLARWRR